MKLDKQKCEALRKWSWLIKEFLTEEWQRAAVGYGIGAITGGFTAFFWGDAWHWALSNKHLTVYERIVETHVPSFFFALAPFVVIALVMTARVAARAVRSWAHGVLSGAFVLPFAIGLISCADLSRMSVKRGLAGLTLSFFALLLSFTLRLRSQLMRESGSRAPKLKPERRLARSYFRRDQESPIESWDEDKLGRSSLVEMLVLKISVSRPPVIALRGNFGDGKSSVLNLLRLQLGKSTIVVSFSSWLPDSQQTFVKDLFGDIAAEVERDFVVPELRKRLYKFASLLGGTVPYLKALPEMLSPYTQREEIRDLGRVLSRIPKRVVILLDEIDRMQKEEVLTLLKILRGVSTLPNLTFVCAFQQEEFEKTACGTYDARSHELMEKFFPTAVDLPKPSPNTLEQTLQDRIIASLEASGWFTEAGAKERFIKRLHEQWEKALYLVCTNIRKIGLVANDLHAAALLVGREVDPLDLCLLEVIRRFYPPIHELIWMNPSFFCRSGAWWKSLSFQPEESVAAQTRRVAGTVKAVSAEADTGAAVYPLLAAMFPRREKELADGVPSRVNGDEFSLEDERERRIAHPDYFPAYFTREVPQTVFSNLEMEKLKTELQLADSDSERRIVFRRYFKFLEENSLRRYDFIHKVGRELENLPIEFAKSLALGISGNAESLGHEFFVSERRRAVSAVLSVAQRLSGSEDINGFISECISTASTDVFAAELLESMTGNRKSNKVVLNFDNVHEPELQKTFVARMDRQYGAAANIAVLQVSKLQIYAFYQWASMGSIERKKEISFWTRYIAGSRRRLAEVFNLMVPPGTMWTGQDHDHIDQMIPRETLQLIHAETTEDETLEPRLKAAIERLERFLGSNLRSGEFIV